MNISPKQNLAFILLLAIALRVISAWFSEGYLMHDDHFWVVETSASWADGSDYNNWLPWTQEEKGLEVKPHFTNLAFSSLHYIYFKYLSVDDPMQSMFILRLIHGLFSILGVFLAYKIAQRLAGTRTAENVGVIMASLAWLPLVSVHQLVEVFVIPLLMGFALNVIKGEKFRHLLLSGLFLGLATGFRYQVGVMGFGLVAAYFVLFPAKDAIRRSIIVGISAIAAFTILQLPADLYLWGKPFAQLSAYIDYNLNYSGEYPQGHVLSYIFLFIIALIPPLSLAIVYGYFRSWKKYALIVLPSLAFIVFHSLFPNKQERFILPALPFIIIAGLAYWQNVDRSKLLVKATILLTVFINTSILFSLTPSTKNAAQMKAMYEINKRGDLQSFLYVSADDQAFAPRFYSGSWSDYTIANSETDIAGQRETHCIDSNTVTPNYIVFVGNSHLGESVLEFKREYKSMSYVAHFGPSRLDRIINYLNPNNPIKRVMLYRIDPTLECSEFIQNEISD